MYVCIYIYICVCVYIYIKRSLHTRVAYMYIYVYSYICMYICIYIYIYKYMRKQVTAHTCCVYLKAACKVYENSGGELYKRGKRVKLSSRKNSRELNSRRMCFVCGNLVALQQ